jgi:hypothetical protein
LAVTVPSGKTVRPCNPLCLILGVQSARVRVFVCLAGVFSWPYAASGVKVLETVDTYVYTDGDQHHVFDWGWGYCEGIMPYRFTRSVCWEVTSLNLPHSVKLDVGFFFYISLDF